MKSLFMFCLLSAAAITALSSCSLFPGYNPSTSLSAHASQTTPDLTPTTVGMKSLQTESAIERISTWGNNNNMFSTYYTFRDFNPAIDNGVVDDACMYKVMYDIEWQLSNFSSIAQKLPAPKNIAAPFKFGDSFGDTADAYDFGGFAVYNGAPSTGETTLYSNSLAYSTNGGWLSGLFGQSHTSSTDHSYSCTKFKYNDSTGEIQVYFVQLTSYPSGPMSPGSYGIRSKISGNFLTHDFFVHIQVGNIVSNAFQLIGKGVSRGTGKYYVVYTENFNDNTNTGYYVVPSSWAEADFQAGSDTAATNAANLAGDLYGYGTNIQAYIDGGGKYTNDISASGFANGGILNLN